jgi:hypothetical protein
MSNFAGTIVNGTSALPERVEQGREARVLLREKFFLQPAPVDFRISALEYLKI